MSRVAYVLYRQVYADEFGEMVTDQSGNDLGSRVALGAYGERSAAFARLAELMRVARRTGNPYALHATILEQSPRAAELMALGLLWRAVPRADWGENDLEHWYDQEAPHLSDDERAKVWALFDARPLYGVYEVPLGDG